VVIRSARASHRDEPLCDRGGEERFSGCRDADPRDELLGPDILEKEPACSGRERVVHVLVEVEGRESDDLRLRGGAGGK
jgi:hypothetical protein